MFYKICIITLNHTGGLLHDVCLFVPCVLLFFLHFAGWDEGGHENGQRRAERGQRGAEMGQRGTAPGQRAIKGSVVTVVQRGFLSKKKIKQTHEKERVLTPGSLFS